MYVYSCSEIDVCFRSHLFVRGPVEQKLRVFAEKGRLDTAVVEDCARSVHSGRVADAQVFFFCGSVDKTISRGFCMRRCFIFIRTYIRFNVFFARKHSSHALRTDNSSSAKSVLQPAGYNARRRALWRSLLLLSDPGIRHRG